MALPFYNWSRTAASNATADSTVNWAEGQAPSSVNDSARAMMASTAAFRDDIAGAIVTGGTSTAFTVTSYQVFDTLAHMSGKMIAFVPHATNGASPTLNVDGLGAKALLVATGTEPVVGQLIAGTPYMATYNNSDSAWYLHGVYSNPNTAVPLGSCIPYFGSTAPNSFFVLPYGQAISRTTYASLFSLISTTYGVGDGSTTFNIPDIRGRVIAGKDDMGGTSANRLTDADDGLNGDTLGDTGGGETQTLVTGNLPAYTPAGSVAVTVTTENVLSGGVSDNYTSVAGTGTWNTPTRGSLSATGTFTGTAQGGTSTAFGIVQPTIIGNFIMRVL